MPGAIALVTHHLAIHTLRPRGTMHVPKIGLEETLCFKMFCAMHAGLIDDIRAELEESKIKVGQSADQWRRQRQQLLSQLQEAGRQLQQTAERCSFLQLLRIVRIVRHAKHPAIGLHCEKLCTLSSLRVGLDARAKSCYHDPSVLATAATADPLDD